MDAATEAAVAAQVERFAAATESTKEAAAASVRAVWAAFTAWYSAAAVQQAAARAAKLSTAGQQTVLGATREFVGAVVGIIAEQRRGLNPRVPLPPVRNGAPLTLVHSRPAERYRRAIATGKSAEEALNLALGRAETLAWGDLTFMQRVAQRELYEDLGVQAYRRVLRPELSRTGSCGLCIAAADRVYLIHDLMPIHPPTCRCITLPVVGDNDPGINLNRADLERLYADAGSSLARDLGNVRYRVDLHGEFGPVLSKVSDRFRGPDRVALEDDPARAARILLKALPVLDRMESHGASAGPLGYQRDLVARLRRITATAA